MHHRDDAKSTRERKVAREVMKLELRQARQRSADDQPGTHETQVPAGSARGRPRGRQP